MALLEQDALQEPRKPGRPPKPVSEPEESKAPALASELPFKLDAGDTQDNIVRTPKYATGRKDEDGNIVMEPLFRFGRTSRSASQSYRFGDLSAFHPVTVQRIAETMYRECWAQVAGKLAEHPFSIDTVVKVSVEFE